MTSGQDQSPGYLSFRASSHSERPYQGPDRRGLGQLIAEYPTQAARRRPGTVLIVLGTLAIVVALGYGLYRGYYGYTRFGVVAAASWSWPWLAGAGVAALVLLLILLTRPRTRVQLRLHSHGIRIRMPDRQPHELRWHEISGLTNSTVRSQFLGIPLTNQYQLSIYPITGMPIHLSDRNDELRALTERLKRVYYPQLASELENRLAAHQWIDFGGLAVHPKALRVAERHIPWTDIKRLQVDAGTLMVELAEGRPIRLPATEIPNLELLLSLIDSGLIT